MTKLFCASGLTKTFGGLVAIDNLTFELGAGEVLGLIGPNGAGKTTVFNTLTGFVRPDKGSVQLDGKAIDNWSPERRCKAGLCRTFQLVRPFGNLTVLDNIAIGALRRERTVSAARDRAEDLVKAVGLAAQMDVLARTLPIGDRKRLELARALATAPRVLLLDEVMGGLTPTEVQAMVALLQRVHMATGVTLIVIDHIIQAVLTLCERVIVLHHGQTIANGTPSEIVRDQAVLSAYLGSDYVASS